MQAGDLVRVALDSVRDLLHRVVGEVVVLAEHRPGAAHLEHHPLQAGITPHRISRDQLASGLLGQIDQDGSRLEQLQRIAVRSLGIDDHGNAVVRRDREEFRPELVALADVDRDDLVGQRQFLQRDMLLVAVGCRPGPNLDHLFLPR